MECPKCGYLRTEADQAPDYECPRCGIVYAKFDPTSAEREALIRAKLVARTDRPKQDATAKKEPELTETNVDSPPVILMSASIPGNTSVCKNCEEVGGVTTKLLGTGWVEAVLYLFSIAPGIIYSVWRRKGAKQVCSACGSDQLVAAKTRSGKQIIAAQYESFTLTSDAVHTEIRQPTFGKLSAILVGLFAVSFFVFAVFICILFFRIPESKSMLFLAVIFMTLALWSTFSVSKLWKNKPVQVNKPKIGLGLVGL